MRVKTSYYDDSGHQVNDWNDWCYRVVDRYTNYGAFLYQTMEFNAKCQAEYYPDPQNIEEFISNLKYCFKYINPQYMGVTYTPAEDGIYIHYSCPSMYGLDNAYTDFIKYPEDVRNEV